MVTLAEALRIDDTDRVDWHVAGKSVSISIAFPVLERILDQQGRVWPGRKDREIGGLLLGRVEPGDPLQVRIEEAAEVASEHVFGPAYAANEHDKQAFRLAIAAAKEGENHAVGFYRTHRRPGLALDADDLLLLSELFPDPGNVALAIKPQPFRKPLAGFFFWEDGRIRQESSYNEFTIGRRKRRVKFRSAPVAESAGQPAATSEPERPAPVAQVEPEPPAPVAVEQPAEAAAPAPPARRAPLWCSWWVQAPLLLCLLAVDAYLGFISAHQLNRVSPLPPPPRDPYALSLTVLEYSGNLHLTWDRYAPAILAAERGQVRIIDGEQSRIIELTAPQLRKGSVTYRKVGSRVRFRLEVFVGRRRSVSESWEPTAPLTDTAN